jgi:hypothetical protein
MEDVQPRLLPRHGIREIPPLRKTEDLRCEAGLLRIEEAADLIRSPEIETPLLPFAVGVLGGVKSLFGRVQVAQHVFQHLPHGSGVLPVAARPEGLRGSQDAEGLVVEHLLEVGNKPLPVGAVAVETVAELIEDPAPAHRPEGLLGHPNRLSFAGPLPVPEQKDQLMGHRELRGGAESAELRIELSVKLCESLDEGLRTWGLPLLGNRLSQHG